MRAYEIRVNKPEGWTTFGVCEAATRAAARALAENVKRWLSFVFGPGEIEVCETLSLEAVRRLRAKAIARGDSELVARCRVAEDDVSERRALACSWLLVLKAAERWQTAQFVRRGGGARAPFTRGPRRRLGRGQRGRSQHPVIARTLRLG